MTRTVTLKLVPKEEDDQIALIQWLKIKGIRVNGSANGGSRNIIEAAKLKRMGVSAGFPDIEIPLPIAPYHGLYIELKRASGGKLSEKQAEWLQYLSSKGYYAVVANGFDDAKKIVEQYLSLSPHSNAS